MKTATATAAIPAPLDHLAALQARFTDIEARRVKIAAHVAVVSDHMTALQVQQNAQAAALAEGGAHDAAAASALAVKLRDAEASVAVARNAAKLVEVEHEIVTAQLRDSQKVKAVDDHAAAVAYAKRLGAAYDEKARQLNVAFDEWKAAMQTAATLWPSHIAQPFMHQTFPDLGAGIVGARPLHPEIISSISQMGGLLPLTGRVADYG